MQSVRRVYEEVKLAKYQGLEKEQEKIDQLYQCLLEADAQIQRLSYGVERAKKQRMMERYYEQYNHILSNIPQSQSQSSKKDKVEIQFEELSEQVVWEIIEVKINSKEIDINQDLKEIASKMKNVLLIKKQLKQYFIEEKAKIERIEASADKSLQNAQIIRVELEQAKNQMKKSFRSKSKLFISLIFVKILGLPGLLLGLITSII